MVKNFKEWKEAVNKEYEKLRSAEDYLNERGKERKLVYATLVNLANFCESAKELVNWIDKEEMMREDVEALASPYSRAPMRMLRKLAEEGAEEQESHPSEDGKGAAAEKKTYYVTFRVDSRFVAAVDAASVEEALKEAQGRFSDADFGEAEDIDGEPIIAEDEAGNYVWEK